jgi:polar amino acid transport system ATP-binding protein
MGQLLEKATFPLRETAKEPIVKYRNITKSFGDIEVIKNLDLDVYAGEKLCIIGGSGSGKTTIIRMLMTLEQPTAGTIEVNGKNLFQKEVNGKLIPANEKHIQEVRKNIGMVFQQFNLFPHMNIIRNCIEAPIHVLNINKKEAEERAIEMLEKVGLKDHIYKYPSQLSGGQQQRVAIARALVMRPKVMLFDEVTSALDPELVGEVLQVIKDLADEGDMAMILITHEMDFARDIADRIVYLNQGVIEEEGKPSDIFEKPKSPRLQSFLKRFIHGGYR